MADKMSCLMNDAKLRQIFNIFSFTRTKVGWELKASLQANILREYVGQKSAMFDQVIAGTGLAADGVLKHGVERCAM